MKVSYYPGCTLKTKAKELDKYGRRAAEVLGITMDFIYIFCIVVASMADLTSLNLSGSLNLLGYLLFAVFGSLIIQALLARLFKIDADTMVIASVTFINSPPFVPMMAAAMKNRRVLVTGLTLGIIGYAVGNYLGFLISELLKLL